MARKRENVGYKDKYRHFHPQDTVWVHNPFEEDVVYQVADESNTQYTYRMPAGKTSELPGGTIATLGVKNIVDRLIQQSKDDVYQMWNLKVRAKYEDQIIVRFKPAPATKAVEQGGEVNLGTSLGDTSDVPEDEPEEEEDEKPVMPPAPRERTQPQPVSQGVASGISSVVADSLPTSDVEIED